MKYILVVFLLCFFLSCKEEQQSLSKNKPIYLDELTVGRIHASFQKGDYTSEDLVSAYLERIKAADKVLNALTYINPNALEEARNLDDEFMSTNKLRPLHGIPLIVKDNFNTANMPTTAGALALKEFRPEHNATMVQQLVKAGAIIIAKSNMAEWAFSPMHTNSSTAGTTRNPYNTAHVPAGSSGGTAAAIAANFGVIGLGSDTGNSIRGPSSHTALVGFRTTMGLTSRTGIVPLYLRNDIGGPMCRTVEDATRVLNLISGYDPQDAITHYSKGNTASNYLQYLDKDGLKDSRIGVLRILSNNAPDDEITTLFNASIKDLERLGASVIDSVEVAEFDVLRQNQWCDVFRQDIEAYLRQYVKSDTLATLEDIIRIGTKSAYAEEALSYFKEASYGRSSTPNVPCDDLYRDGRSIAFRNAIEYVMDSLNLDALVYPSWNNKPAQITQFREEYKGDNSQVIAPHTGQPAFTVPMGYTEGDLPAGLQFLGRMYSEPTLIKLCYAYEQGTLHRRKPNL